MKIKQLPSIILMLLLLAACQPQERKITAGTTIEGDLYFGFLRMGSLYNAPDTEVHKYKLYADSLLKQKDLDTFGKKYTLLQKENLLYHPFVEVRLDNDSIINLYLDSADYEQIRVYTYHELRDAHKKLRIKAIVQQLGYGMVVCKELVLVEKMEGVTQPREGKFKIEDYQ